VGEHFFKYHGLGNDFIVLDRRKSGADLDAQTTVRLCDRRRGVGADGVLVLLPSRRAAARMVVHNADGSIPEMCGNGLRLEEASRLGPMLEHHPAFPARTNVEFARIEPDGLTVLVWERGCGLTQACGTGACAAVVAAVLAKRLPAGTWLRATLPGGDLRIRVPGDLGEVRMRGPATFVLEGKLP